jgi:4-carboxymuconolactone decarboxylase
MKTVASMIMALSLMAPSMVQAESIQGASEPAMPVLEAYTRSAGTGELKPRDRSLVTLATLIAQKQTAQMPCHLNQALANGVEPREIQEMITHLAFFSGWKKAMSAAAIAREVFAGRDIDADPLAPALGDLLLLGDEIGIDEVVGSPGLLRSLWLRPDLSPRDRRLVTVSALIALGQVARIPGHLEKAMDGGGHEPGRAPVVEPRI